MSVEVMRPTFALAGGLLTVDFNTCSRWPGCSTASASLPGATPSCGIRALAASQDTGHQAKYVGIGSPVPRKEGTQWPQQHWR
jgi:hypothetical protein